MKQLKPTLAFLTILFTTFTAVTVQATNVKKTTTSIALLAVLKVGNALSGKNSSNMNTNKNNEKKEDEVKNPLPQKFIKTYKLEGFKDILNLPVVHATWKFPENGRMIPGKFVKHKEHEKIKILKKPCGWRPTLHWSIGNIAPDIPESKFSNRPYIIITTLEQLLPQLIGLNYDDAFILGEFTLPDNSYIIVRSVNKESFESHKEHLIYHKEKGSIDKTKLQKENNFINFTKVYDDHITLDSFLNNHFYQDEKVKEVNKGLGILQDKIKLLESKLKPQESQEEEIKRKKELENNSSAPDSNKLLNSDWDVLSNPLKMLADKIEGVKYKAHDRHEIGVIEMLNEYVCLGEYLQEEIKEDSIKEICEESKVLKKDLFNHYVKNLQNKKRNNLYNFLQKENEEINNMLTKKCSNNQQKNYLENFKKQTPAPYPNHETRFKGLFLKAKYLQDPKFMKELKVTKNISIPYVNITNNLELAYYKDFNNSFREKSINHIDNKPTDSDWTII